MLILTRRIGESIRISDDITITVVAIRGAQVRLGIAAPSDIDIVREELLDRESLPAEREVSPQP